MQPLIWGLVSELPGGRGERVWTLLMRPQPRTPAGQTFDLQQAESRLTAVPQTPHPVLIWQGPWRRPCGAI